MRYFYASIIDGAKRGLLAGPYDTKAEAERAVPIAKRMAYDYNPTQAAFAGFGTAGSDASHKTVFGKITL